MGADFRLHQGVSMSRPIRLTVGAGCQWFRKWCVLGARSSLQLKSGQSLQLAAVASSGSRCFCSLFSLELPRWMELSSDAMSNVYQFSDRNKSVIRDASNLYISSEGTILNFYPILGGKMEKKPGGAVRLQEILNLKVGLGFMVSSCVKNNSWQWWYIFL